MKLLLAANKLHENLHLLDELPYPVICSPKMDGIRSTRRKGKPSQDTLEKNHLDAETAKGLLQYSRSTDEKPHPSKFIQNFMQGAPQGLDGEMLGDHITDLPLGVRKPDYKSAYSLAQTAVQTIYGEPNFNYCLFDTWANPFNGEPIFQFPYEQRLALLLEWIESVEAQKFTDHVQVFEHRIIGSKAELLEYEEECLDRGFEGIMIRTRHGVYLQGRFTINFVKNPAQGGLIKLKREFKNGELQPIIESTARIIGVTEEMFNGNEARRDESGRIRRQSLKENMVGKGRAGALICKDPLWPETFRLRGNISHALAQEIWDNFETEWKGWDIDYCYQERGSDRRPRFPQFMRKRIPGDS